MGNQPVAAANISASSASRISGMDNPTNAMSEQARSTSESLFTAAQIPSGTAMHHATSVANNDSRNVFHSRAMMSSVAEILYWME